MFPATASFRPSEIRRVASVRRGRRRYVPRRVLSAFAALMVVATMTAWSWHQTSGVGPSTLHDARELDPMSEGQRARLPNAGPRRSITCSAGSVVLRRARNIQEVIDSRASRTTFCFKSKIYRLQEPIRPKSHNTFIGEYGAILDGSRVAVDGPESRRFHRDGSEHQLRDHP